MYVSPAHKPASPLTRSHDSPLTHQPGGPVDKPVGAISARLSVQPDQVLLAWAKAKGAIVVTYVFIPSVTPLRTRSLTWTAPRTSSKKSRLQGYLDAGDIGASSVPLCAMLKVG
jgi:hypothetical protein